MYTQLLNEMDKDVEKFIRFMVIKSTQVVVQSRLGEKVQTQCNPLAGNNWFNLVVHDHPDISNEIRRVLAQNPGESILERLPVCIEISLRTVEGDQMVLEVWSLDVLQTEDSGCQNQKTADEKSAATGGGSFGFGGACNVSTESTSSTDSQTTRLTHAIYNRMSIMLKSLISLTRATPGYKLSRRQCPDSYGIYYRIYVDRPQTHTLGEGHKQVRIGQLNTIIGTLVMSVAYRTKMTISPTAAGQAEANTIMLKSDHFRPTTDSTSAQQAAAAKNGAAGAAADKKNVDIEKPLRPGAFAEISKLRQYTENDYVLPETPPFEWLLQRTRHESTGSGSIDSISSNNRKCESPVVGVNGEQQTTNTNNNNVTTNNNNNNNYNLNHNNNNNLTTFKSLEKQLQQQQPENCKTATGAAAAPIKALLIPAPINATRHNSAPTLPPSAHQSDDDNLLKELNFPFASPTSNIADLAKFYRDCYHAPPLRGLNELQAELSALSCNDNGTSSTNATNGGGGNACGTAALALGNVASVAETCAVDDLSRQLEQFETSLEDYDKLVSQFGLTTSSSTGSRSSGGLQMSN